MSLQSLDSLHFPRCVIPHAVADDVSELHLLCDASQYAHGACAYIQTISVTGQVHVALLASKGRLAPIKPVSIPRLELTACLEAVKLDVLIRREVDIDLIASTFWTDSQVALAYIHNDTRRFKTCVANRVARIRDTTSPGQWHHICGNDNPADVLSRGCDVNNVPELWFSGAGFLSDYKSTWPTSTREYDLSDDVEVTAGSVFVADGEPTTVEVSDHPHPVDKLATYYSSFYKLCKAVTWLMRFKRFPQTKEIEQGHISSSELSRSRDAIVKVVQQSSYPKELHDIASKGCVSRSSRILKLSPMIADGILVVGGRLLHSALSCKRPPILPRDHPISRLIVRECHGASHLGTEWTLSNLRMRYWIVGARNVIKQVRRQCMVCKRLYAAPLDQRMADLPPERCSAGGTPFDVTGMDLFGPILVKVNRGQVKRWGCIFTCFKSRAIHIEVLSSLEADSFINGFIRSVSMRGCPSKIYSDNGTNFVGAQAEIARCLRQLDKAKVRSAARRRGVDWEFNTPLASHHGGVWERLIRSIRKVLLALFLPHMTLTDEVLYTVLCECECIINGRPITKSSDDVNDWEALTPNHLLAMRGVASLP